MDEDCIYPLTVYRTFAVRYNFHFWKCYLLNKINCIKMIANLILKNTGVTHSNDTNNVALKCQDQFLKNRRILALCVLNSKKTPTLEVPTNAAAATNTTKQ